MAESSKEALALKILPVLVSAAKECRTLTYGQLASAVGRDPTKEGLSVASALKTIHKVCAKSGVPSLDALVLSADRHEVGSGLSSLLNPIEERKHIFNFLSWDEKVPTIKSLL